LVTVLRQISNGCIVLSWAVFDEAVETGLG
jgi:hypothetical protein